MARCLSFDWLFLPLVLLLVLLFVFVIIVGWGVGYRAGSLHCGQPAILDMAGNLSLVGESGLDRRS